METIRREKKMGNLLSVVVIVAAVCLVFAMMQGVHDNYGIMLNSLVDRTGLDYAAVSFVIGVGALMYGMAQPFMGMLALRRSHVFVMLLGIVLMVAGLIATPFCRSFLTLLLFFGLVLPIGTTGIAYGILMGAMTPLIGEQRAALVSGIVQASAGIGDSLMAPAMERAISGYGIAATMTGLSVPFLAVIPVVVWIGSRKQDVSSAHRDKEGEKPQSLREILAEAFRDRDYRCVLIGFSTCGFNL